MLVNNYCNCSIHVTHHPPDETISDELPTDVIYQLQHIHVRYVFEHRLLKHNSNTISRSFIFDRAQQSYLSFHNLLHDDNAHHDHACRDNLCPLFHVFLFRFYPSCCDDLHENQSHDGPLSCDRLDHSYDIYDPIRT